MFWVPEQMLENGDSKESGTPHLSHPFLQQQEGLFGPREQKWDRAWAHQTLWIQIPALTLSRV